MYQFYAITPIILLLHESRSNEKANHTITPTAGGASIT